MPPERSEPLSTSATSHDIRQFRDAVAGVLKRSDETLPAPDPGWRRGWSALADLGVVSFGVAEEHDGSGPQVEVAAATAMELGAALHGSPYAGLLASTHALSALAGSGSAEASEVLADVIDGQRICAFGQLDHGTMIARNVDGAPEADALVLLDPVTDELLLLTDPTTWQVRELPHPFDVSRRSGEVTAAMAGAHRLGACSAAPRLFGLLLAADALGGTERALDRTVAYARDRQAFGRSIGGFQAVQHRLADHAVQVRGMELLVREAARSLAEADAGAARAVALAEASVSAGAAHVLHDLLQLTGAIGFTWEYGLHFFQRRAHQDARLGANPRRALHALADLEGWSDGR